MMRGILIPQHRYIENGMVTKFHDIETQLVFVIDKLLLFEKMRYVKFSDDTMRSIRKTVELYESIKLSYDSIVMTKYFKLSKEKQNDYIYIPPSKEYIELYHRHRKMLKKLQNLCERAVCSYRNIPFEQC